jgi:Fe-S cluster assembly protein SufD
MTIASPAIIEAGFTRAAFEDFLASRREPDWLTEMRRAAWEAFEATPLPDMRQEEWRRTDIRLLRLDRFGLPGPPPAETAVPGALLAENVELAGQMVALDSHPVDSRLEAKWRSRGVLFGSLDELVVEHGDLLRPHMSAGIVNPRADKFAALHASSWSGGTVLYVPRGVSIDQPLHILSALSGAEKGTSTFCAKPGTDRRLVAGLSGKRWMSPFPPVDFGHTLVVLEEGAEATLLAETASAAGPSAAGLHCGAVEIVVGPHARLRYVNLQNWGTGVWHFAHQRALVHEDAQLQWTIGALGARLAKVNQHVALVGRRATTQVNGVMFTEGKQHVSYHTLQHHQEPECSSDLRYKGALQDNSHIVWRGMIHVDRDAQKTDGYQRNDNLMLSDSARADSIPGLEILADDVRCTHGATAGRVDDEQVFYALTRGLTRKEAIRMIVAGFFQEVFDRITIDSVRNALGDAIRRRVREYQ